MEGYQPFPQCLLSFSVCAQSPKSNKEDSDITYTKINVTVNGITNTATLVDLGSTLPQNNTRINTNPGDIILYLGNEICFYYDTNSWNFTHLGKLDMTDEKEIRKCLNAGNGKTEIVLSFLK